MTATKLATRPRIVGDDRPPSPQPLTMGELIMPSYDWTRVCMHEDKNRGSLGYWTARVYQDALALNDLYVLPPARRQGVGSRLLEDVITHADSLGLPVALYCSAGMNGLAPHQLRDWYVRRGFITHPHFSHKDCQMDDLMLRYPS